MKRPVLVLAILAVFSSSGWARTIYVATNGQHVAPFTNSWIAATNIQSAVDVATNGDVVLVGDGTYALPTTVNITNGITLKSLSGPQAAILNGRGSVRGLYLDHTNARVEGFTIRSCSVSVYGTTPAQGGGIFIQRAAIINSCIIFSNRVEGYGYTGSEGYGQGGGIFATSNLTIRNCLVYANIARGVGGEGWMDWCMGGSGPGGNGYGYGGGLYSTGPITTENCTIVSNQASGVGGYSYYSPGTGIASGGGVYAVSSDAAAANSIIQSNEAITSVQYGSENRTVQNWTGGSYTYSSTLPQPGGEGNITNAPQFVSVATGDFHLGGTSPCIDAGRNADVTAERDLEDNPRIVNATVDMGAYEYLGATTGLRVTLFPTEAVAGAQWHVDDGAWQNSGTFLAGLSVGSHTVNCSTVSGFLAPADRSISIAMGQTASVNGLYVQIVSPTISVHPVSQTNIVGASASFSVVAGGPDPLHYQWQKDSAPISGAATSQYALASLVLADSGAYRCLVSNAYGVATSGVANLLVLDGTNYVRWDNPSPDWPYTSWGTAATNIQDAINAAGGPGALVLVSNGMYQTGGRVVSGSMTNRVVIHKPITVRSVNGPAVTFVLGAQHPATTNGNAAVRCVWMTNGASLSGFTLTNGATRALYSDNEGSGGGVWCPSTNASVSNCTLTGNAAYYYGGGSYYGTLYNCTLSGNSTYNNGGGAYYGTLYNCSLSGNAAYYYGGGSYYGTLYNCTLFGNSAGSSGGGSYYGTRYNCIVYYNAAPNGTNYSGGSFNYSCTTPNPGGTGNIITAPRLLTASHIATNSPCVGAGSANYSRGTDIDGNPWRVPPAMGCDEPTAPATGSLAVSIGASATNAVQNYSLQFSANIQGIPVSNLWTFGDGGAWTNQAIVSHAWAATGLYAVVLRAWNDSNPGGVSATVQVRVVSGIYYVNGSNATPALPFDSWATAATNIQDAVDEALPSSLILVTNGVYGTGGRPAPGYSLTNRVTITKPITVRSVNGPSVTIIQGAQHPATTYGNAAVRCVWLTNGASLSGFTLTNGATQYSDGNDGQGGGVWCPSTNAAVSNCTLTGNAAYYYGGGAYYGTLYNCALTGNSASYGGGAFYGTLYNCTLTGNSANNNYGGGAYSSTLYNCALSGNSASYGGGVYSCTLYNCTLAGNSALYEGGGANNCTLYNSIAYYNAAPNGANCYGSYFDYSCTTPDLGYGTGNITNAPMLLSPAHISTLSPCVEAGSDSYATGVDLDGDPWYYPPAMGCDEPYLPATGALAVAIRASATNAVVNFAIQFSADIQGIPVSNLWTFGDGGAWTNQAFDVSHAWAAPGLYAVVLRAWNDSNPGGVSATVQVRVVSGVHYVNVSNAAPSAPFDSWGTAATNIQDAVDAAALSGSLILVTNGIYGVGGRPAPGYALTNRVTLTNIVTVRSVNGPAVTIIQGAKDPLATNGNAAVRCVWMTNGASLSGFTLTNGATRWTSGDDGNGGGVWCPSTNASVSNCMLSGNSAYYFGGGASYGTLNNCALTGNSAQYGGGAFYSSLYNCTLTGNLAYNYGGGSYDGTRYNCIVYYNTAPNGTNYSGGTFSYSCTTPSSGGTGCITNDPQFLNRAAGNFRLSGGSPCIDKGSNTFVRGTTDLDWNPRIANGIVDMGAYEYAPTTPIIALNPSAISAVVKEGQTASNQLFEAWNGGILTLDYLVATNVPWLSVHPASGSSTGEHDVITVSLATAGLAAGSYTGLVTISSASAGNTPQICTITLTVIPRLLDHFAWNLIASPQHVGTPIAAQLIAQDAENLTVFRFTNTVSLAGLIAGGVINTNIGIGAGTSSTTYPMGAYYHDQRTQVIYLTNEIGGACSITSLAVNVTTIPGQTMQNWTIRLKHTPLAAYPVSPVWEDSGWTTVYQIDEPQGATGWRTFIFNSPFEYNGTDNLMVDFSFNNGFYTSSGTCQYSAMSESRTVTFWTDSGWGDPLAWAGTSPTPGATVNVPNIRLDAVCGSYTSVLIAPDVSGAFTAGVWDGTIAVAQEATNLFLRADDGGGHRGDSVNFDVSSNLIDTDGDGIPDDWEAANGLNPSVSNAPTANADGDWMPDFDEYVADTRPTVSNSVFPFIVLTNPPLGTIVLVVDPTSADRVYGVRWTTNLLHVPQHWTLYPPEKIGTGSAVVFTVTNEVPGRFYRTGVRLP